jgi:hypothetical protein
MKIRNKSCPIEIQRAFRTSKQYTYSNSTLRLVLLWATKAHDRWLGHLER